ncbi:glycerol dehydratase reactivase beta/small subunit family protein [Entomohabitans teleogrylli]|uniref:glycerol dehydratase reactivase beta/small subunit family protein n=1 Tax=Entomohabitans teleogrylli TaxID=1384589 RepID=UPI00073D5567|nr:glycerol dehydratase reactivase beta/small subunit family protein [Entomohabitans teleogrylli]
MDLSNDSPTILIYASAPQALWQEVLFGIEEEGIPWQWLAAGEDQDALEQMAWQAANRSPLLVGLACNSAEIVVHYRHLPVDAPLFRLGRQQENADLRHLGNNAARLVKGLPFR